MRVNNALNSLLYGCLYDKLFLFSINVIILNIILNKYHVRNRWFEIDYQTCRSFDKNLNFNKNYMFMFSGFSDIYNSFLLRQSYNIK